MKEIYVLIRQLSLILLQLLMLLVVAIKTLESSELEVILYQLEIWINVI